MLEQILMREEAEDGSQNFLRYKKRNKPFSLKASKQPPSSRHDLMKKSLGKTNSTKLI